MFYSYIMIEYQCFTVAQNGKIMLREMIAIQFYDTDIVGPSTAVSIDFRGGDCKKF